MEKTMKNKFVTAVIVFQIIGSFVSVHAENHDSSTGQSLLIGTSELSKNIVEFRSLDKGPLLFDEDYNLPTSLEVEAGKHELSVMCEFTYSEGYTKVPGINITTKGNTKYHLTGKISDDGNSCDIEYK